MTEKTIEMYQQEITELKAELQDLRAQIAYLQRMLFGKKSEKYSVINPNQTKRL